MDLAKARLLIARSDKAKKTRKSKVNRKDADPDQENKDPNEDHEKKKKAVVTVAYVTLLNNLSISLTWLL
jgi:hypothetical protein